MTAMFLSEANKLKNIQLYLEKNDNLLNLISKHECDLNLVDNFVELEKERKSEADKVENELRHIWQLLRSKKKLLQEGNVAAIDLRNFKHEMVELHETILNLKTKLFNNVEKLKDKEKSISEMTELYNQKVTEWEKAAKITNSRNNATIKNKIHKSRYKEVIEFMDFVEKSNGHENGWSSNDHQLFLNLRHKYKNVDQLALHLNKLLPDISTDDVRQHEAWFCHYTLLKNKKDEALDRWRKDKTQNICQNVEKNNNTQIKNKVCLKQKDENIHEKIALWKAEKEAKRQQINAYEQMQKEQMKRLEANKRRFDHQVKQEVMKWKEAKIEQEQNKVVQKELEEFYQKRIRAATANKLIKLFQTQDDYYIARMRSQKLKDKNKTEKRSKSSYSVDRDPERILKPTKQWLLRTSKDESLDDVPRSYIPNIREIPRLKIPDWRRSTNS